MRALGLVLLPLVVGVGCTPRGPTVDFAGGTMELALTNPDLSAAIKTYVAIMIPHGDDDPDELCGELLGLDIPALNERRQKADGSAAQAFTVGGGDECVDGLYVFGNVDSPGTYSYLLLGSTQGCEEHFGPAADDVEAAQGSVIAIGCRDRAVAAGESANLKITLFPAGLR